MTVTGFQHHDHQACVTDGLEALGRFCRQNGLRLTPLRQAVFQILLSSHRAVGAYEILHRLGARGLSPPPPVAYRHLDFLVTNGFAHRIEKLNAFIACMHIGAAHDPAFLICRNCRTVSETDSDASMLALHHRASDADFQIESSVVEVLGICPECRGHEQGNAY